MKIKKGRGYTYGIEYHFAWSTCHKRPLLKGEREMRLKELLQQLASQQGFEISHLKIQPDAVRISVQCSPQLNIPTVIKLLKGTTARTLLSEFPDVKNESTNGSLWNASYFAGTWTGDLEFQISDYLKQQPESERKRGRPVTEMS